MLQDFKHSQNDTSSFLFTQYSRNKPHCTIAAIFGAVLATLPESVLGGCTIMMFGNIVISGLQMIGACGFSQRNITIAALSLSIGLGFTQVPEMFAIFPDMVRTIFAENCVSVVFLAAIIMNLLMPKDDKE